MDFRNKILKIFTDNTENIYNIDEIREITNTDYKKVEETLSVLVRQCFITRDGKTYQLRKNMKFIK